MRIAFVLDGEAARFELRELESAMDVLRDRMGPGAPREGCLEGECGACAILVDGEELNACVLPAPRLHGADVTTAAGLARDPRGARLLRDLGDPAAAPCGFCAPGFAICAWALRQRQIPEPRSEAELRVALAGHLCRCTDYAQLVDRIQELLAEKSAESGA